jgi:amino acid permease
MRSCVIVFVTGIALIIPDFTVFLDIAGSLGASVIAFVLPPLLYNVEFSESITPCTRWSNYAIVVFGVAGGTLSIVNSCIAIANGDIDE